MMPRYRRHWAQVTEQRVAKMRRQCVHVIASGSAIVLLLIAQVEFPQFALSNTA